MTDTARTSPVTLHDVAREAGVSLATASRSLNGSTRNVKAANRERVLEAAERLGYSANASAQAVARGTTTTVALLVGDIADPYFSSIAAGVVGAAEDHHLVVTMAETRRDTEREVEMVRALRGQRPRAIILAASRRVGDPHADALAEELSKYESGGGRVVFISTVDAPFRMLHVDNAGGARALGTQLAAMGYRSVAILAGPGGEDAPPLRTSEDRLSGFRAGLAEHGIEVPPERVVSTAFTRDGGYEGMQQLLTTHGPTLGDIDLVFAVNDVMAVGAMSAARDAGLIPGRDIAIAGFDDIPTLRDVTPRLTTASLPLERVGEEALALALAEEAGSPALLEAEVAVRESTPGR
ncbi:LacI family DNA-binding transcriptional regulator [Demequina sp. NBRC 110055]|uniref:LacI family DNA-binding transcriptional regulator n=1 Tax=Demequina sp. NBRC 110055 TaxID=1570344 RepID=UPI000A016602|nr:LacI family DNA-binding transcriptional regulator [Demequina sp. NBRC 110055]